LESQGVKHAAAWLAAAGGAPLLAKYQSETANSACPDWMIELLASFEKNRGLDIGSLADKLAKLNANTWLDALQRLSIDLNLCAHGLACRYYPSQQKQLNQIVKNSDVVKFTHLTTWLNQQKRVASHPLNAKLFSHAVLQRLSQVCKV